MVSREASRSAPRHAEGDLVATGGLAPTTLLERLVRIAHDARADPGDPAGDTLGVAQVAQ